MAKQRANKKAVVRKVNGHQAAGPGEKTLEQWLAELRRELVAANNAALARIDFLVGLARQEKH